MGDHYNELSIRVRLGSSEDLSTIAEVEQLAFATEPIPPLDEKIIRQRLMAMEQFLIIVAEGDDQLIGHALGYPKNGKMYLWSAAVRPKYRGQGVMTTILQRLFEIAYERGFKHIFFETSNKSVAMLRLALNMGFEIVGYYSKHWRDSRGDWIASVTLEREL